MKAFQFKNQYYKVIEERGDFFYGENASGKVVCRLKSETTIEEIEALPKARKYYNKKRTEVKADPIQTWKNIALSVNDRWNSNSTWLLAQQAFSKVMANGNTFIQSLLDAMFIKERLSEKQAYYLAKYGVENGFLN